MHCIGKVCDAFPGMLRKVGVYMEVCGDAFPGMLRKVGVCMEVCGDAFPGMCRV